MDETCIHLEQYHLHNFLRTAIGQNVYSLMGIQLPPLAQQQVSSESKHLCIFEVVACLELTMLRI